LVELSPLIVKPTDNFFSNAQHAVRTSSLSTNGGIRKFFCKQRIVDHLADDNEPVIDEKNLPDEKSCNAFQADNNSAERLRPSSANAGLIARHSQIR
jgi:hypothetical protein